MADFNTMRDSRATTRSPAIDAGLRDYMNRVYALMSIGMLITGAGAWIISSMAVTTTPEGPRQLTELGRLLYGSPLKWVLMFAPLAIVFAFGAAINRLSASAAQGIFFLFSALMGVSLGSIFLIYTPFSIVQTFLVTAIAFAGLSLYGYTTKRDMSGMGTFLMMGLIGLIVAMIVNLFLQSGAMGFAISAIGVLLFAALTAYDTQRIKQTYLDLAASDRDFLAKGAIMGALTLYLDFLNMFQFLLAFMGQRE